MSEPGHTPECAVNMRGPFPGPCTCWHPEKAVRDPDQLAEWVAMAFRVVQAIRSSDYSLAKQEIADYDQEQS